jgi:hypothetical protein
MHVHIDHIDTYRLESSHMSRNARTLALHSRRIALGFGTAAGAAAIATSLSMGAAPVAGADVSDADAVSSLAGALDLSALGAASTGDAAASLAVSPTDAISYLIDALDPQQFTSSGAPAGLVGDVAWYLDYYLFGPTGVFYFVDAALEPYVEDLVNSLAADSGSAATVGAAASVGDVIGALDPSAFNPLDSVIDGLVGSSSLF